MNETDLINETAEKLSFWDLYGKIDTVVAIFLAIAFIMVFCLCLLLFRRKINEISKKQISHFKKEKKYIPDIYIELNDNMEHLRFFFFGNRWKSRVIRRYNLMFKGYVGDQLKFAYKDTIKYRIPYTASIKKVQKTIINTQTILNQFRDDREQNRKQLGDFFFVVRNLTHDCLNSIDGFLKECDMISERNMIIVGSAGNGKTSLVSRATELAIKNRIPCLLINSKNIKQNVESYIVGNLPLLWKAKERPSMFLWISNLFLALQRKYFFIVIDAINENDREVFIDSIGKLYDSLKKYSRIKILMSCRSEYFDVRYEKLFDISDTKPYIFRLDTSNYDERAKKKFLVEYRKYYKVEYRLSGNIAKKINNSLFLMRIFFEVNSGKLYENLEFQDERIYKSYIDKVACEHSNVDFRSILQQLATAMIASKNYNKVPFSLIQVPHEEKLAFRNLLDNNLIISQTIEEGSGLSEREEEYIYFVFDEFRDYCLARYLVIEDENKKDHTYKESFKTIDEMYANSLSPLEGIVKYSYIHFRTNQLYELCEKILFSYGNLTHKRNYRLADDKYYFFNNFGLTLIFMSGGELQDIERKYFLNTITNSLRDNINALFYVLDNNLSRQKPGLEIYMEWIFSITDYTKIQRLSTALCENDRYDSNQKRYIDYIYDRIDMVLTNKEIIDKHIQLFLIVVFACESGEWYYKPDEKPIIFDDWLFDELLLNVKCKQLQNSIFELKVSEQKQREQSKMPVDQNDFIFKVKKGDNE